MGESQEEEEQTNGHWRDDFERKDEKVSQDVDSGSSCNKSEDSGEETVRNDDVSNDADVSGNSEKEPNEPTLHANQSDVERLVSSGSVRDSENSDEGKQEFAAVDSAEDEEVKSDHSDSLGK